MPPFMITALKYGALFLSVYIGWLIYANDHDAPELLEFSVSPSELDPANGSEMISFSGVIEDARSVDKAQFVCRSEQGDEFIIVLVLSGGNQYKVGFGKITSSPDWRGSWEGTKPKVTFSGTGVLPAGTPILDCVWEAQLGDNLGNYKEFDTDQTLKILSAKP